ncbi:hypothetical protein DXA62_02580 [Coprobacillus sp. OF03-2AA]|uniref:3'-5' exonuclease n=1 Tax=Faecalibacillus intestinalis TaxID=1982626 RepID=UPI000E523CA0|nr:3'-5' exonuclease [Faecalibacillus intestinalis]RHP77501.1 hypothetical protein DXA62_02580 [Coprobacillus sp. OF03-2AA]
MQCIIIDVEANYKSGVGNEIISLAAYRTHIKYVVETLEKPTKNQKYQVKTILVPTNDCFYSLVKPVFTGRLNKKLKKLLNIDEKELEKAETFDKIIEKFQNWVAQTDEETVFGAWSDNDFFFMKRDCQRHYLNHIWFTKHYFDLQKAYDLKNNKKTHTSLSLALNESNIEFDGQQHNALDDSKNTMRILNKTF